MGWSMSGILAGAAQGFGKGIADWAGREIADEKKIGEEARLVERQKEMARYNDELAGARDVARAELTEKIKERVEMRDKESKATVLGLAGEEAAKAGLKEGTPEFFKFVSKFADDSGEVGLGEKYMGRADKFEDNALRRKQIEAQLSSVAESRRGRDDAKVQAQEARKYQQDSKIIETLGTLSFREPDPDNPGKSLTHKDETGQAALISLYQQTNGNMQVVSEAGAGGQALQRSDPKKYPKLGMAIDAYSKMQIEKRRAEAAKK